MIQLLAKFPPDTRLVQAYDWSPEVIVEDYTNVSDGNGGPGIPTLALSTVHGGCRPVTLDSVPAGPFIAE
jgi:hypothetical protein